VQSLSTHLAALEARYPPPPTALDFNVRSTVEDPMLTSSPII